MEIPEPTAAQASAHASIEWQDEHGHARKGVAGWYPSMGGYVGICLIEMAGSCVDVYLWHDGDFPFEGEPPIRLHHCDPVQFVEFGKWLQTLQP